MTHPGASIDTILRSRKMIITCGTGGVGKTTLGAALAIQAAFLGKKTVVVTIDPAKRLATSLGLQTLNDTPTDLTPQLKAAYKKMTSEGLAPAREFTGTLAAIMPDTRQTFERFIYELAPSKALAERVMKNPIFQIFSKEFSGTNEYMALERLLTLHRKSAFDCIILDTPPTRNALAFLDAPKLLAQFFDEKLIRWLVLPANRLVSGGMRKALGILEKLTGAGFMTNLFDFGAALFEVQGNVTGNLRKVTELLESPEVGFMMVTAPTPETVPEILHFIERLKDHQFRFEGIALNRTLSHLQIDTKHHESRNHEPYAILKALQKREALFDQNLQKNLVPVCARIPELARDVHSLEDLIHVALALNSDRADRHTGESGKSPVR